MKILKNGPRRKLIAGILGYNLREKKYVTSECF
jgi:hypothetical protein